MTTPSSDDVQMVIDDAVQNIANSLNSTMDELRKNWSQLGVDNETKMNQVKRLLYLENILNSLTETTEKLNIFKSEIAKLEIEISELSKCLSIDIPLPDYREYKILADYKKELEAIVIGYRDKVEQHRMNMKQL